MPTVDAAEASLINDAEFLDQLESFEPQPRLVAALEPRTDAAIYSLDEGLEVLSRAETFAAPESEQSPIHEPYDDQYPAPPQAAVGERGISFATAAIVLVACLTAGAATAAYVFHERLAQITAPLASR